MNKKLKFKKFIGLLLTAFCISSCSIFDFVYSGGDNSSKSTNYDDSYSDEDGKTPSVLSDINNTNGNYSMPSVGNINILVIPVKVKGYESNATAENKTKIEKSFFGSESDTSWESLKSFYTKSSYGKLNISGTVSDWFDCGYTMKTIASFEDATNPYFDPSVRILTEAVSWYKQNNNTKCTEFDSDSDGLIDGVWLVYSAPNYSNVSNPSDDVKKVFWAYTYSNYNLRIVSSSNPNPYRYCWASYDFMFSGYGTSGIDSHTYIHETGHLLGLDDYYVASVSDDIKCNYSPTAGIDMMDNNIIDHNTFSKMILGWLTPTVVTSTGTYTLKSFEEEGNCLIIPTDHGWNGSPFDEYMLVEFYTPTNLNKKDSDSYYPGSGIKLQGFSKAGVRIYHIDARMVLIDSYNRYSYVDKVISDSSTATTIAHSNSSGYNYLNPQFRLIQLMDATKKRNFDVDYDPTNVITYKNAYADNSSLFVQGNSFTFDSYKHSFPRYYYSNQEKMNNGYTFSKTISISSISSTSATITIS